jgi:predicted adenylyl cyclase CyaB
MIEVEMRGALEDDSFSKLKAFLEKNAKKQGEDNELVMFIGKNDTLNLKGDSLRIKKKGDRAKLVFKGGTIGEEEEIEVRINPEDILGLLGLLNKFGFEHISFAPSFRADYVFDEIRVSLKNRCIIGPHFEMEILVDSEKDVESAKEKIKKLLARFKLKDWSVEDYKNYKDMKWRSIKPKKISDLKSIDFEEVCKEYKI